MFQEYAAEFAFNEGANDGYWRFQLRGKDGRWIKMGGMCSFEFRLPNDNTIYRAYGTFQGNVRRGWSIIRVGEGESLAPGDYEIDSRYIKAEKAIIRSEAVIENATEVLKKIDEAVEQDAAGRQVIASTVGDLEVGDIVQQSTDAGLYGRIASVDHSGETTKLNVEWSDGTAFDMDLPKDQKIKVWNSQNADVPTTNGGLDWANNDDWYQQALDEYDDNRAVMNGDSNAPTDFVPGDNLLEMFEGYNFDPYKGFDTEKTKSAIIDFSGRKVVIADINGVKVPFYLSTGHGGKKDVESRKWYPFFGLEQGTGWLNKGNGKYINDYYGSPELRAQAEWLDANIGDIMDDTSYPYVRSSATDNSNVLEFADVVNADTHPIRLDKEGLGNDKMDTLIKANIADIVNRVRMEPGALQKKADEAKARVDAVKKQMETVDAPKGGEKEVENLPATMDGEEALATIRNAAAEVALEDGRFPVARSAEDIEAGAKKQYADVFDSLKEEYPDLVKEFKDFEDFWGYAKKSLAAGTTTRYADSVDEIPPLMRAANRIYARDVLGVDPDGLITFYRNSINGHADVAKSAAGYASLDRNMAFNYNSDKGNDGANGRYSIKAKPSEVRGLLGYSDAADEHGVVIGPDVTAMDGRVERLGDLGWTPLNPLMDPNLTARTNGGSGFRHFSTASTFDFPVLDSNPFAQGEADKWSDFYAANGLEKGAIPSKYDEIYGEGAFERDFPNSSGVPRYDIARDLFTEKDGQFALDPIKFDGNFKGSNGSMVGTAGDGRDKALKFFEAVQQLSGQRFMSVRGEEESTAEPETVDAPNVVEEAPAVGKRLTEFDFSSEDGFWHGPDTEDYSPSELKSSVSKAIAAKMREMGISDEDFAALSEERHRDLRTSYWDGSLYANNIKVWDGQGGGAVSVLTLVDLYRLDSGIEDETSSDYISRLSSSGDLNLTVDDVKRIINDINQDGYGNRRYRLYPDIPADERSEMAASAMIQDWANSSNDDNHRSLAIQQIVESVFGITGASDWTPDLTSQREIDNYKKKFKSALTAYVRAQYEATQERFKDAGISEVVVYRGMNGLTESQVVGLDERSVTSVDIQSRPLSSWSTNSQVAYEFAIGHNGEYSDEKYRNGDEDMGAALLMRQVVPIDQIFSTPFDGVGCYSEREVVLLGGESRVDAVAALGDESMKSVMDSFDTAEEKKRAETRENPGAGGVIGRDEIGNPIYEEPASEDKSPAEPEKPKDLFAEPTDPAVIAKMKADEEARKARQAELDAEKEKRQQEIRDAEAKAKAEEEAKKKKKKVIPSGFKNWFSSLEQLLRYKQENDPVRGNTILSKFLAAAGFNDKPKVVSQAEFDAVEGETIYRAVNSREQVEHFKESDLQYAGVGSFGNGTYTSNKKETTVYYAGDYGDDPEELEARTMEMKLSSDAKVLDFEDASDMYEAIKKMCNEFIEQYIASGADPADVQEVEWKLHNNSDWTNVAIMLGYDAVRLGVPTNFGGQDKEYYTIILNRGKVIINGKS